jgi:hypothetical protein
MAPGEAGLLSIGRGAKVAEVDALSDMVVAQTLQCAVDVDGGVPSGRPDRRDDPLGLAEGVGTDQVAAFGEGDDRSEEAGDLHLWRGVAEDGQGEGRLGHEDVAGDGFEGRADGGGNAGIVARDDDALGRAFDRDLGRAEDMAGRVEVDGDIADPDGAGGGLAAVGEILAVTDGHDVQRFPRRHDRAVAGAGVVGMAVGDQGAGNGACGVDVEIAAGAIKPLGSREKQRRSGHAGQ